MGGDCRERMDYRSAGIAGFREGKGLQEGQGLRGGVCREGRGLQGGQGLRGGGCRERRDYRDYRAAGIAGLQGLQGRVMQSPCCTAGTALPTSQGSPLPNPACGNLLQRNLLCLIPHVLRGTGSHPSL